MRRICFQVSCIVPVTRVLNKDSRRKRKEIIERRAMTAGAQNSTQFSRLASISEEVKHHPVLGRDLRNLVESQARQGIFSKFFCSSIASVAAENGAMRNTR